MIIMHAHACEYDDRKKRVLSRKSFLEKRLRVRVRGGHVFRARSREESREGGEGVRVRRGSQVPKSQIDVSHERQSADLTL